MLLNKLKTVTTVLFVALGMVVFGGGLYLHQAEAQQGPADKSSVAEERVKVPQNQDQTPEKEGFTAWGKEVGGLRAGLGYKLGQKRAYSPGETVTLVVRIRNVVKKEVKFHYLREFFLANPPLVTDGAGKPVTLKGIVILGEPKLLDGSLAPGKELALCELNLELRPVSKRDENRPWTLYETGKFQLHYENVGGGNIGTGEIKFDPVLSKLATGKLELDVKEAFTAWGKEVGGLQAGLGFKPGEKRAYSHGETVTLVVRVRNAGKEEVKLQYARQFFTEKPPAVTDDKGKPVPPLARVVAFGDYGIHIPVEVNLAPGKEIELYELKLELRPGNSVSPDRLWESGKVQVQYERLARPDIDEILSKLATGKLELEVKTAPPKPEKEQEKEAFTAWGQEVGGLQAGLGFRTGEHRAYHHGETVTLVYRIRNVGKKEVKFEYLKEFFTERPFNVTDGDGKPVPQEVAVYMGTHLPVEWSLAPGKEIELYENKLELRPGNKASPHTLWASGKVHVWYERLFGNLAGQIQLDPTLSKLATGKLELEVKSERPAAPGKEPPQKKNREDADAKPIKIRVHIEKVNVDTATITASCLLIGALDNVTKPLRFENLRVAEKAKIADRGKEVKLTDLQLLPRDTHFYLLLKAYEEEMGFEVVGIETIRK